MGKIDKGARKAIHKKNEEILHKAMEIFFNDLVEIEDKKVYNALLKLNNSLESMDFSSDTE